MSRLILTLNTRHDARCPWCQQQLESDCFEVVQGIVFCSMCYCMIPPHYMNAIRRGSQVAEVIHCWTCVHGVHIYTPPDHFPRNGTALMVSDDNRIIGGPPQFIERSIRTVQYPSVN